ncbi:MAG: AAA family ATPase, partial [Suipraeoptans sp.]
GDHIKSFIMESSMPRGFFSDVKIQEDVVNYLSSFDNSIKGFRIEDLPQQDDEEKKEYKVSTIHKSVDSDTEVEIPLTSESSGTLKMLSLYQKLQDTIIKGGVLMIDELNARLHPLLVRNFILTFLNPEINKNHAQLIFTSHETWLLSKELLRRDEIWFVEKSNDGDSMLYSLADFIDSDGDKIRKDENYEKNYLLGKYGAIPTLKGINIPKEV